MFRDLFFVLSNKKLLNGSGQKLSHDELQMLWFFYNLIRGGKYSKLIMRGESNENLNRQFFVDTTNPVVLAERLFMTGEKSRICWTDRCFLDPEDASVENFERICESLSYYIHDGMRGLGKRAERLKVFVRKNESFCNAFENINGILSTYSRLSERDRIAANLHYLSISHTINSIKFKNASGFVSATTDAQIADGFSADAMIYGWVPKNVAYSGRRTIDHVVAGKDRSLKDMGLPYPENAVYPEQSEITIRCGLLPHFIIGFTVENAFYVNPAVFATIYRMYEATSFRALSDYKRDIQLFGMVVNQEYFEVFLQQTGFKRYFTFDGDEYVIHNVVQ